MLKTLLIHFDFTNRITIDYFCPFWFYGRPSVATALASKPVAEPEACPFNYLRV